MSRLVAILQQCDALAEQRGDQMVADQVRLFQRLPEVMVQPVLFDRHAGMHRP